MRKTIKALSYELIVSKQTIHHYYQRLPTNKH